MLEVSVPVNDRLPETSSRFGPARMWSDTLRCLRYCLAAIAAVLLVATISPRLVRAEEAWQFFAVGTVAGCTTFALLVGLGGFPPVQAWFGWLFPVCTLVLTAVMMLMLAAIVSGISISPIGAIATGLVSSGLSFLIYQVFDAPRSHLGD